jgi:hypothetical protein
MNDWIDENEREKHEFLEAYRELLRKLPDEAIKEFIDNEGGIFPMIMEMIKLLKIQMQSEDCCSVMDAEETLDRLKKFIKTGVWE